MILDKANTVVTAYPTKLENDGYGGQVPSPDYANPVMFKAFCIPVGFSGAGWAINSKLQSQGWADVARVRVLCKPMNGASPSPRWAQMDFQGRRWTVQDDPRVIEGFRSNMTVVEMTVELLGDLDGLRATEP